MNQLTRSRNRKGQEHFVVPDEYLFPSHDSQRVLYTKRANTYLHPYAHTIISFAAASPVTSRSIIMLNSIDQILQQFEISHYGFLPIDEPLAILPDTYYAPWESIISHLPCLIRSGSFYDAITKLPHLTTQRLRSIPEWRRAYVILTFFTHAYIWSGKEPTEVRFVLHPRICIS